MNTRLDRNSYNTSGLNCKVCKNPAVVPHIGEKPYCVRCNISIPEWMISGRGR